MQIGSSLLAAQQAAREAQARFQAAHAVPAGAKPAPQPSAGTDTFQPLPLKQSAPQPQANARPGNLLDIKV